MQTKQLRSWLWEAGRRWYEDKATRMSSSLSYYTLLSLAPVLVLVVSIAGIFLGEDAARGNVARELTKRVGPQVGSAIESIILYAREPAETIAGTTTGLLVLLVGASSVFNELQSAMNTVWEVKPKPGQPIQALLREHLASFVMVLSVALLLLALLLVGAALTLLGRQLEPLLPGGTALWRGVDFALSLLTVTGLFVLSFKFVPAVHLRVRDVLPGAVLTALMFALGELALGAYIQIFAVASPYGAAGSAIVLVVWVYYFFQILFFGAEFTKVRAAARGVVILPKAHAVRAGQSRDEPTERSSGRA